MSNLSYSKHMSRKESIHFPSSEKQLNYSLSTQESPRINNCKQNHKEKSQLCKKFVENGYCPYENKCKFAHGLHQLRNNKCQNSKYKTKLCGSFLDEGYCSYGNRCNFIHPNCNPINLPKLDIDIDLLSIRTIKTTQSRLLKLLK